MELTKALNNLMDHPKVFFSRHACKNVSIVNFKTFMAMNHPINPAMAFPNKVNFDQALDQYESTILSTISSSKR